MVNLNFASWWGRQTLEANRTDLWQLGSFHLWIQPLAQRLQIQWHWGVPSNKAQGNSWLDSTVRIAPGGGGEAPAADAQQVYCVYGNRPIPRMDLLFVPTLADRPLITRLSTPLHILPGETAHLYVVVPLHLRIEMAENGRLLHEIPTHRLSDTWFGPMSSAGELCFAGATPALLDLRDVPLRLQTAISAVAVHNAGKESLRFDRVNVPLPQLSLFYSPRTGFWTDAFSLTCEDESEMATLKLERQPPPESSPHQFVAGPRQAAPPSRPVVRAFTRIFGERPIL
jgi:hypothetical protein